MTEGEFAKIWKLLGELWPNRISSVKRRVWEIGLRPYPMAAAADAVMEYARREKFFPDMADICKGLPREEEPEPEIGANELNEKHIAGMIARWGSQEAYLEFLQRKIAELRAK